MVGSGKSRRLAYYAKEEPVNAGPRSISTTHVWTSSAKIAALDGTFQLPFRIPMQYSAVECSSQRIFQLPFRDSVFPFRIDDTAP